MHHFVSLDAVRRAGSECGTFGLCRRLEMTALKSLQHAKNAALLMLRMRTW